MLFINYSFLASYIFDMASGDPSAAIVAATPPLLDDFLQYRKFPAEVRLEVMKYLKPGPRVVEVLFARDDHKQGHSFHGDEIVLLSVNRETRYEILKTYRVVSWLTLICL